MKRIIGMYGFNPMQLAVAIQGFNICSKSTGIKQAVEECWKAVIESEKPDYSDERLEFAAWALERAITLRGRVAR
jgi:selenophosphate synthase